MKAEELWSEFCRETNTDPETPYEAWAFGGAPEKLARLVIQGIKTATASAYDLYALDDSEAMPKVGDYSVILNSREEGVCVIRTTKLSVVPFDRVGPDQAYMEGEGDRSLAYWRQVHEEFFREELEAYGLQFSKEMKVLCEEFRLVYLPRKEEKEASQWN